VFYFRPIINQNVTISLISCIWKSCLRQNRSQLIVGSLLTKLIKLCQSKKKSLIEYAIRRAYGVTVAAYPEFRQMGQNPPSPSVLDPLSLISFRWSLGRSPLDGFQGPHSRNAVGRDKKRKTSLIMQKKPSRIRKRKLLWNSQIIWLRKISGKCLRKVSKMWPQVINIVDDLFCSFYFREDIFVSTGRNVWGFRPAALNTPLVVSGYNFTSGLKNHVFLVAVSGKVRTEGGGRKNCFYFYFMTCRMTLGRNNLYKTKWHVEQYPRELK